MKFIYAGLVVGVFRFCNGRLRANELDAINKVNQYLETSSTEAPVTVQGIVTGDFTSGGKNGFFIQMTQTDAKEDPIAMQGIFVYCGSDGCPVKIGEGDLLRVEGTAQNVKPFGPQIINPVMKTLCVASSMDSGRLADVGPSGAMQKYCQPVNVATINFPVTSFENDVQPFRGMLVSIANRMTVTETFELKYGTLLLSSGGRVFAETMQVDPKQPGVVSQLESQNALRVIKIDDGMTGSCPVPQFWPVGGERSVRVGHSFPEESLNGTVVATYQFNSWTLLPTQSAKAFLKSSLDLSTSPRVSQIPVPENKAPDGQIRISGLNVENYFKTYGSRGAKNEEEFVRQQKKIFETIRELDGAVFALQEMENKNTTLASFVQDLNAHIGSPGKYQFIPVDPSEVGIDAIQNAIIFQPSILKAIENPLYKTYHSPVKKSRVSIAQKFQLHDRPSSEFVIVANHLKSKGSKCQEDKDGTALNGEGNCGAARLSHAKQLMAWVEKTFLDKPGAKVAMLGDFNSHSKDRSVQHIVQSGLFTNLAERDIATPHSYVFQGKSSTLDYFFASKALSNSCSHTYEWSSNADEALLTDYQDYNYFKSCGPGKPIDEYIDVTSPFRSSDHDPIVTVCNI